MNNKVSNVPWRKLVYLSLFPISAWVFLKLNLPLICALISLCGIIYGIRLFCDLFESSKQLMRLYKATNKAIEQSNDSLQHAQAANRRIASYHDRLVVGELYILVPNERENISVAEFVGYQDIGENKNKLSIFKDVIDGSEFYALCVKIRYTPNRFKALSSMDFKDVIELVYFKEDIWEFNSKVERPYIDPMENYNNYVEALKDKKDVEAE